MSGDDDDGRDSSFFSVDDETSPLLLVANPMRVCRYLCRIDDVDGSGSKPYSDGSCMSALRDVADYALGSSILFAVQWTLQLSAVLYVLLALPERRD
jgi:hypothetical protein